MAIKELTTSQLARRLGVTTRRARFLLQSREISGVQLPNGTWLADPSSVAHYEMSTARGPGRTLDPATAWGLLWELSGLDAGWLSTRTRARVRRRIRDSDASAIALAVSKRAKAHHFAAANVQRASADLIKTGRAAVSVLGTNLIEDNRRVCGYVRSGSVPEYAASHFMVPQIDGHDILYENSLPITYTPEVMPAAVVAADLAVSTDTRERSAALEALELLRQRWLAAN